MSNIVPPLRTLCVTGLCEKVSCIIIQTVPRILEENLECFCRCSDCMSPASTISHSCTRPFTQPFNAFWHSLLLSHPRKVVPNKSARDKGIKHEHVTNCVSDAIKTFPLITTPEEGTQDRDLVLLWFDSIETGINGRGVY
ncbi:hypothetical protein NPIL_518331 [Nephila pilipes]|uniref:Uncharacterized protein n=1 Tax=Nephila pilipes TaxID=299642 RepID=A0A8X6TS03_NEPPI|nr:hypothetical protein NPIL_518331 [Nephila pilipes]